MEISNKCVSLVKSFEGFRDKAYQCSAGVWTIGYGTTDGVEPGDRITPQEAEVWLKTDFGAFAAEVDAAITVSVTQNMFDALVSLAYNIGTGAFKNSTLLRLLNEGQANAAADQFDKWVSAGGRKLPGLVRRREIEKQLFLS